MAIYKGPQKIKSIYLGTKNTNCLTYVPENIKLELNNGTLTLKAGSKVYVPKGFKSDGTTPKFDEVVIGSDINGLSQTNLTGMFFLAPNKITIRFIGNSQITSGTSATISNGNVWYDTSTNLVKMCNDGSNWTGGYSLPICVATSDDSTPNGLPGITSINQIFQWCGYIGSTAFVLPGVKGLIPNGFNADGTYNVIERTVPNVRVKTDFPTNMNGYLVVMSNTILNYDDTKWWKYDKNKNLFVHEEDIFYIFQAARLSITNGKITSLTPAKVQPVQTARKINYIFKGSQLVYASDIPNTDYLKQPDFSTAVSIVDGEAHQFTNGDGYLCLYNNRTSQTIKTCDICPDNSFAENKTIRIMYMEHLSGISNPCGGSIFPVPKGWWWKTTNMATGFSCYAKNSNEKIPYKQRNSLTRLPDYTTGLSISQNEISYATKDQWLRSHGDTRKIEVATKADMSDAVTIAEGCVSATKEPSTMVFIEEGLYFRTSGTDNLRFLCKGV